MTCLIDEDEIETEQDFKRLLGNGRMYAKLETKHEQKLSLNQLIVLETLRNYLNEQSRVLSAAGASVATGSVDGRGGRDSAGETVGCGAVVAAAQAPEGDGKVTPSETLEKRDNTRLPRLS